MNLKLKKTISAALTLIMLISCFSSGIQAFAEVTQVIFLQADGSESRVYNPTEINSDTYELTGGEYGTKWYTTVPLSSCARKCPKPTTKKRSPHGQRHTKRCEDRGLSARAAQISGSRRSPFFPPLAAGQAVFFLCRG